MLAKAFTVYTLQPDKCQEFYQALTHDNLEPYALKPRHKTQQYSLGFMPPMPAAAGGDGSLVHTLDGAVIFRVGQEKAVIKNSAIDKDLAKAVTEFAKTTGEAADKGEIYEIKERITAEHLASAKTELMHWHGWLDLSANRLVVAAGGGSADDVTLLMRNAMHTPLGGLAMSNINTTKSPTQVLTAFISNGGYSDNSVQGPRGPAHQVVTEDNFKFKGVSTGQEVVIKGDHDPEFITLLLDHDYQLNSAKLCVGGRIYLTLDQNWSIKGAILNPDAHLEEKGAYLPESNDDEDEAAANMAAWQANAFLTVVELRIALNTLIEVHGGLVVAGSDTEADHEAADPLLNEAISFIKSGERAPTISSLQRKLKTGYNRSARLMDTMQGLGIVSAPTATGGRTLLTA